MLSYRHGYHAGNFADVFKHSILCLVVQSLQKKDKPFVYLDTHAGAGIYELNSALARKNREHTDGIIRIWRTTDRPEALTPYLNAISSLNQSERLGTYPGSPKLAQLLLRPNDRMELCELHSSEVPNLKAAFKGDRRVHVHQMDGYQALKAFLPPAERRGVVLCDPAYELKDERKRVISGITDAWQRWPTGLYIIWYPILERPEADWFHRQFKRSGIKKIWASELRVFGEDRPDRLNGTGMIVINPPWQLDAQMNSLGPWLAKMMAQEGEGHYRQSWLVAE